MHELCARMRKREKVLDETSLVAGGLTESHLIGVGTIPHDDGHEQDRLPEDTHFLDR
jgi:hypothetical protein